jgi:hypothetical protein
MYFFDFEDYWTFDSDTWSESGNGGSVVGCGGGAIPADWEDLLGTARATRDAFKKAVAEWFITSAQSGFTQTIDQGCSPTYLNLWVDMIEKQIEFDKYVEILTKTLFLFRFNYDYSLTSQATYPTYEDYFDFAYNNWGQETGTTTNTVNVPINPFPPLQLSAVSVTYDYGTSFETSDLETLYNDYDTSMKEYMCSIKNMWSVIDGDTFDELWVDDDGNFIPNSGTTYCLI